MPIDEIALIRSCQAGNLQDFDPLYREYVKPIYAFVYRRVLDRQTAEDITSITFMKALEKISSYRGDRGVFAAWLYRIARNCITDHYRTNRPHTDIEDVWDLSSDEDVELTVDDRLNYEKVRAALQTIDAGKREIVMLRIWEGLSYKEIAEITGKSEANCKVIFSRTMDALRSSVPLALFFLILSSPFRP
jgi:RNA polymerase sigma-70 factor, ECF subfamily